VQLTRVVPAALAGFVRRGGLGNKATWRLLAANLGRLSTWSATWSATRSAGFDPDRYPAHLHVGLDAAFRGRHLGRRLVEAFLSRLAAGGVPGVHAVVLAENAPAGRFFERLGFRPLAHGPALRRPGQAGAPGKVVYGRSLAAGLA